MLFKEPPTSRQSSRGGAVARLGPDERIFSRSIRFGEDVLRMFPKLSFQASSKAHFHQQARDTFKSYFDNFCQLTEGDLVKTWGVLKLTPTSV
jgi:hypothetical protein